MAKNSSSNIHARRMKLIEAVEAATGVHFKRANINTTTGGLSVSNKDMILNSIAHLACNEKNFPIIEWLLEGHENAPEGLTGAEKLEWMVEQKFGPIPEEHEGFGIASIPYACGSAPRVVMEGSKHVSKDAVKLGVGKEFVSWAQAQRIAGVGGYAGMSASVREGIKLGEDNGFGNLIGPQVEAAREQIAMRTASEQLDRQAFRDAISAKTLSLVAKINEMLAQKLKAAPVKAEPATVKAPATKPKAATVLEFFKQVNEQQAAKLKAAKPDKKAPRTGKKAKAVRNIT